MTKETLDAAIEDAPRIVIIGGGPAGYEAAIAGAKYGAQITLVEEQGPGGSFQVLHCWCKPAHRLPSR